MEYCVYLVRLRNTGLVNAGIYRLQLELVIPELGPDQAILPVWSPGQPRYSVRGRSLGPKSHGVERQTADGLFCTPFQVDYEDEDVEVNESCLFHVNASVVDIHTCLAAKLMISLEYKQETGFRRIETQIVELNGDRYGLRDAGVLFFRDLEFGSATLDIVVLSSAQTLIGGKLLDLVFPEEVNVDKRNARDDVNIVRASRKLGMYLSPYQHSLYVLEGLAKELGVLAPPTESYQTADSKVKSTDELASKPLEEQDSTSIRAICEKAELEEQIDGPKRILLWHAVVKHLMANIQPFATQAKLKWMQRARDVSGELFIRESLPKEALSIPQDPVKRTKEYRAIAEKLRSAPRFSEWDFSSRPLSGSNTFLDEAGRPVVFEQRFDAANQKRTSSFAAPRPSLNQAASKNNEDDEGIHLVVLVHGFLGTRWDMRVFELVLSSLNIPGVRCKAIQSNENHSEWPLEDQGVNVAGEIVAFAHGKKINKLSFVAYSMGTVVVRFALNQPIMRQFDPVLQTFVSVAGPHLGSTGSDSALVGFGQWALMKWKRIASLAQLGLEDDTLLKLSQNSEPLSRFKIIALVSSADDTYVPSFSARMELPAGKTLPMVQEMQRNLVEKVLSQVPRVSKIEMAFEFASKRTTRARVDAFLGRAAHVHILDSIPLTLSMVLIFGDEWFG